jgi:hypothetical protein
MSTHVNNFPKLHNAAWPGVVGKGPDSEPPIDLDTMLNLGVKGITIGPKPPGFITPNVFQILQDKYDLRLTGNSAAEDLAMAMAS